ncbi:hypothetical protein PAPYR_11060 [Paratrimastix pyriformis]|uniref:Uncharacterized protein n=1 Tax=Paratrimastix pyriformis TaxID=342808 RepID=A0ABQ8U7G6_9EUKA|nr:hypothetical protein PAPYR_11060 [Paratrimastix pyriformis]
MFVGTKNPYRRYGFSIEIEFFEVVFHIIPSFQNPYRRYGFSIEIEFFEVVFRHHPRVFFDETSICIIRTGIADVCLVLKSIPAVWIYQKSNFSRWCSDIIQVFFDETHRIWHHQNRYRDVCRY